MYYKIARESKIGIKLQKCEERMEECKNALALFLAKIGAEDSCLNRLVECGGCEVVIFSTAPDPKLWRRIKEVKNGYLPRLTCREGKAIDKEMRSLPFVTICELNQCFGIDKIFTPISFKVLNSNYYGVIVPDQWDYKIPEDWLKIS